KHLMNNSYLSSKTNSINQNLHSTTAILVGTIYYYKSSSDESTPHNVTGKHVILLQDIFMIITNHSTAGSRTINVSWLTQPITSAHFPNKNTYSFCKSQALMTALQANPMPVDSDRQL
ncbi:2881_t:CDS:2, partial [Gigaspora margarita]